MIMTVSADTLSVTCSGWTANDQTCTFEVRTLTQDCGFTSDAATNNVTLSCEYCVLGYLLAKLKVYVYTCTYSMELSAQLLFLVNIIKCSDVC